MEEELVTYATGSTRSKDAELYRYDLIPVDILQDAICRSKGIAHDDLDNLRELAAFDLMGAVEALAANDDDGVAEFVQNALSRIICVEYGEEDGILRLFTDVALRYGLGASRHGPSNWKNGQPIEDVLAHLLRHLTLAWAECDEEDDHIPAAIWGCIAIIWYRANQVWIRKGQA